MYGRQRQRKHTSKQEAEEAHKKAGGRGKHTSQQEAEGSTQEHKARHTHTHNR